MTLSMTVSVILAVIFLDMSVTIKNGVLHTDMYRKPTQMSVLVAHIGSRTLFGGFIPANHKPSSDRTKSSRICRIGFPALLLVNSAIRVGGIEVQMRQNAAVFIEIQTVGGSEMSHKPIEINIK